MKQKIEMGIKIDESNLHFSFSSGYKKLEF